MYKKGEGVDQKWSKDESEVNRSEQSLTGDK